MSNNTIPNIHALLNKYNQKGPRYTSYPPATFFNDAFGVQHYQHHLKQGFTIDEKRVSLYFHIPFCNRVCLFCGCNSVKKGTDSIVESYIQALIQEMTLVAKNLPGSVSVSQVHWGGGTPNAIPAEMIERIMNSARSLFNFDDDAELAIECNPAYLDHSYIDQLAVMGFNRISLGIQDFDIDVLSRVHRDPSLLDHSKLMDYLRGHGFNINIDLIYGLPGQLSEHFRASIDKVIALNPDRIVTFSYAHVPWVQKRQKGLERYKMVNIDEKIEMLVFANHALNQAGYLSIGMDHFAKEGDALACAVREKTLHRNFQGYTVGERVGQVLAFGASSISQLKGAFVQNKKGVEEYITSIKDTGFAVERGYELQPENIITSQVIESLMCNNYVDLEFIAEMNNCEVDEIIQIVQFSEDQFKELIDDNCVEINRNEIRVTDLGTYFVRNIAMLFDPLLNRGEGRYSQTV